MSDTSTRKLISFGSFLGREMRSQLKEEDRPENEHIRWTPINQLHLAWQGFFRSKDQVNFGDIEHELETIKSKFFPMLVNLYNTNISPNKVTPTSLMWDAEILEINGERTQLEKKLKEFQAAVSDCLKKVCVVPSAVQASPHVVLGRFPKNTPGRDIEFLEDMQVPQSKFLIEDFGLIEAVKEGKTLSYNSLET